MTCPKCGSEFVNVQMVTEQKLVKKKHGWLYWLTIGWWWEPLIWCVKWLVFTIPALIISLFPLLFGGSKKKKTSDKEIAQKAMDNTINQIAEQEDLSSDAELVAVIAAAIATYEGSGSTDGFRVRSIRKVNTNWKKNR